MTMMVKVVQENLDDSITNVSISYPVPLCCQCEIPVTQSLYLVSVNYPTLPIVSELPCGFQTTCTTLTGAWRSLPVCPRLDLTQK